MIKGDVDRLLSKSVVGEAWVGCEAVWSWSAIDQSWAKPFDYASDLNNGRQALPHHRRTGQC